MWKWEFRDFQLIFANATLFLWQISEELMLLLLNIQNIFLAPTFLVHNPQAGTKHPPMPHQIPTTCISCVMSWVCINITSRNLSDSIVTSTHEVEIQYFLHQACSFSNWGPFLVQLMETLCPSSRFKGSLYLAFVCVVDNQLTCFTVVLTRCQRERSGFALAYLKLFHVQILVARRV